MADVRVAADDRRDAEFGARRRPPAARAPRAAAPAGQNRRRRVPAEGSGDGPKLCAPPSAILTGMLQANGSPRARPLTPHLTPPDPEARADLLGDDGGAGAEIALLALLALRGHLLGLGLRLAVLELYMMNLN